MWTYLTIPFLYTYPGFVTEELPPWREDGETWRPLKATFPDSVASHSREQVSYFGEDGLLRRHEYTVDVMGGAGGVNYALDYRDVDGILVPTSAGFMRLTTERTRFLRHCLSRSISVISPLRSDEAWKNA